MTMTSRGKSRVPTLPILVVAWWRRGGAGPDPEFVPQSMCKLAVISYLLGLQACRAVAVRLFCRLCRSGVAAQKGNACAMPVVTTLCTEHVKIGTVP